MVPTKIMYSHTLEKSKMSDNSLIDFSEHDDHEQGFSFSEDEQEHSSQEPETKKPPNGFKKFDAGLLTKRRFLEDEPE